VDFDCKYASENDQSWSSYGQLNHHEKESWEGVNESYAYESVAEDDASVYYAQHLEEEWNSGQVATDSVHADSQPRLEHAGFAYQRPCSFFLEGNCRRSDCKFSHDLRRITCKFWEESSCFKGDLCPFLHGYDETIPNESRTKKKPSFTIESEMDFPSLAGDEPAVSPIPQHTSTKTMETTSSLGGKRESQVLLRMVGKKRKKGGQQKHNEKAV